ncbi:hypothetical protein F-M6_0233 [Faustovirus]|nr:hypothetical protein F-M6_0233 [Faustovirus]QJX72991.1 hypothetical protein F-VV57_0230 [Faustovirus]QJX73498.1 hypothetical protein F-VV63_0232 [Faustovirus]
MSFLHEIINNIDEYVLILGASKTYIHGSDVYKSYLYVYNLTIKYADVYYFPQLYEQQSYLHPDLEISHPNSNPQQINNALWLLRQETHGKTPLIWLFTLFLNIEELKKEPLFANNKVLSNHSTILNKFKAIYISKGQLKFLIRGFPGYYTHEIYRDDIKFYIKNTVGINTERPERIYIDVLTPHNIAKKMQKIWRKISSPEHDLVDVFNA